MKLLISLDILIPIGLVVIILIAVMWYLYSKNKKLYNDLVSEAIRFHRYKKGIESLKNASQGPKKDFENLNSYARAFFKEYLNLDYSLTYLELSEIFKKQNKKDYADFCALMSDINYSGRKAKPEEVRQLIDIFYKIIDEYK